MAIYLLNMPSEIFQYFMEFWYIKCDFCFTKRLLSVLVYDPDEIGELMMWSEHDRFPVGSLVDFTVSSYDIDFSRCICDGKTTCNRQSMPKRSS
jgi:hypothetical protein